MSSASPSFAGLRFPVPCFLFSILFLRGELKVAAASEGLPYRAVLITGAVTAGLWLLKKLGLTQ